MGSTKSKDTGAGRWVTGSAYEFLGLSPEEAAYVDLKLRLSKALRRYRALRPLSQGALAKLLKSSQSRVAKMENGDPSVSIDLLLRALIRLGVTRSEIARLLVFDEPKPLVTAATTSVSPGRTEYVTQQSRGRRGGRRAGETFAVPNMVDVLSIGGLKNQRWESLIAEVENRASLRQLIMSGTNMPPEAQTNAYSSFPATT